MVRLNVGGEGEPPPVSLPEERVPPCAGEPPRESPVSSVVTVVPIAAVIDSPPTPFSRGDAVAVRSPPHVVFTPPPLVAQSLVRVGNARERIRSRGSI